LSTPDRVDQLGILDGETIIGREDISFEFHTIFKTAFSNNPVRTFDPTNHPEVIEAINAIKNENE